MSPASGPIAAVDLTAKARIRNCALQLYAQQGEDRTSMRAVATAAGVTVGLVVHHYGSKDGVREAVELRIVDYFADAIATVPRDTPPEEVAAARNIAVAQMLKNNPDVVSYLRRAMLETAQDRGHIIERLTDLTVREVEKMRSSGTASVERSSAEQTIDVLVNQLGKHFLQPLVDTVWDRLATHDPASENIKPELSVRLRRISDDS